MNKQLLLMRHAEAEDLRTTDFERRLSKKGLKQASAMAEMLNNIDSAPDAVLHSAALRTTQTAQQLSASLIQKTSVIIPEMALYNAPPEIITETIQMTDLSENIRRLLVIAHNPGISWLATACGWNDRSGLYFPPAGIAAFDLNIQAWADFAPQYCRYLFFKTPGNDL